MRLVSLGIFVLGIACAGGGSEQGGATAPTAPAVTPPARAIPTGATATAAPSDPLAALGADADVALADHFLVILGSKRDPAEVIPGVAVMKAHPELAATVRQVRSSRFKNLMPCYAVTIAGASPDKKAAFALSKRLSALGVDNYVKNAGAWVGASAAIDAYCAAGDAPLTEEVRVATLVDGHVWIPVPDGPTPKELPDPVPLGEGLSAWVQPLGAPSEPGRYTLVDAQTGRTRKCSSDQDALLTLGTPHFGVLQSPDPPSTPQCGSPARYHRLACDGGVEAGAWVAVPDGTALVPYEPLGEGTAQVEAAKSILTARTDWDAEPEGWVAEEGPVERTVTVTRWKGLAGDLAVVEGSRAWGNGVCGGDDTTWIGVFAVHADALGAPLGPFHELAFANARGLVDIGADGRPDLVVTSFPDTTTVYGGDGPPAASLAIDYCDCPC